MDLHSFIHTLSFAGIPEAVRHEAKRGMLDTIGVGLGALELPGAEIIRRVATSLYGGAGGVLWCHDSRVSVVGAAMANSLVVDQLDQHDSGHEAKGHAGAAVVPSALLLAKPLSEISGLEHLSGREGYGEPLTGEELVAALVVGYEVAYRAGETLAALSDHEAGVYFTSGAWNAVGVAAMWARRLRLSAEETQSALAMAEYHSPRGDVLTVMDNPAMVRDGSGFGSWSGVGAAVMASMGFTAGQCTLAADTRSGKKVWADLGEFYHLTTYHVYKRHPACYWAQAAIHGALALRGDLQERGLGVEDVAAAQILTFPEALTLYQAQPATSDEAQYNLCYGVGSMLARGFVDVSEAGYKGDKAIVDTCSKVSASLHPRFVGQKLGGTATHDNCAEVRLTLRDGAVLSSGLRQVEWDTFKGQPGPTDDELVNKFKFLARAFDESEVDALVQSVIQAEGLDSASSIERALGSLRPAA